MEKYLRERLEGEETASLVVTIPLSFLEDYLGLENELKKYDYEFVSIHNCFSNSQQNILLKKIKK